MVAKSDDLIGIQIFFAKGASDWTLYLTDKEIAAFDRAWRQRKKGGKGKGDAIFPFVMRRTSNDEGTARPVVLDEVLSWQHL